MMWFNVPLTTVMQAEPQFLVSSERLEEQRIEPATFGAQDQHTYFCATTVSVTAGDQRGPETYCL